MATTTTPQFFQNDFGFLLTFTLNTNLSTSTDFIVRIVKPMVNGERAVVAHNLTQTAILDPVKGVVGYVVEAADMDVVGSYLVQLSDVTPGRRLTTKEQKFTVKATVQRFEA